MVEGATIFMERNETRANIIRRLKRIEGQLKGIQRMVDNEACCSDVLTQIAAVKAAVGKVGILIFENHARECMKSSLVGKSEDEAIDELMNIMSSFIK